MKFKVIGYSFNQGKRREIEYGEFDEYPEAYDLKEFLEDKDNWKKEPDKQPYLVFIKEIDTEDATIEYDEDY